MSNFEETRWPMIFTPAPGSSGDPNVDVRQGQGIGLTVRIIQDPNFVWNTSDPPSPRPPDPKLIEFESVTANGNFPQSAINVIQPDEFGNGGRVSVNVNSLSIYPFQNIRLLMDDNSTRNFNTEIEVENFYNQTPRPIFLVTSCVPVDARYINYSFTVRGRTSSTATPTVTGTFHIRIESVYRQSQNLLLRLLEYSSTYIDNIKNNIPPSAPPQSTSPNSSVRGSNSDLSYPVKKDRSKTSVDDKGFNLDEKLTNDPSLNKKVVDDIDNEHDEKDFYDIVKESLDNRTDAVSRDDDIEDDDCWCDPSLGIEEIKRRIDKWQE